MLIEFGEGSLSRVPACGAGARCRLLDAQSRPVPRRLNCLNKVFNPDKASERDRMAEVHVSKRYDVPGQTMWERIGDPGKISEWHPAIETTEMLDGGKTRIDTIVGGGRVSETILEQADRHHTYRIDESPLPVKDLIGTIRVRDESKDACVVEWDATFEPTEIPEDEAVELVRGIFQAGLDAL